MNSGDLKKKREILFARFPPGQVPEAANDLEHIAEIDVQPKFEKRALAVSYDLSVHTLRELDEHLIDRGYHLDNTLMSKLTRALVYYVEDTQLHNMAAPEKRLKRSAQEAYVHAWEHHPHGDHDDTPPEWREYK
ncbi:MAG TPA: hypothetical protein PK225_08415 [Azonexus sp.]|jgi:hypothetical protein|nr:hypothetical protein [Azonexus sp.]